MLMKVWRQFVESIDVMHSGNHIQVVPIPVQTGTAFPFIPTLIGGAFVGGSAGEIARGEPKPRHDELRKEEFIQIGHLSHGGQGSPRNWSLVLKAEVEPACLLRAQ